jgi:hypothetical protein
VSAGSFGTRPEPRLSILDALDDPALFGAAFADASWRSWRGFLAALFALSLPRGLQSLAKASTGRSDVLAGDPYL